MASIAALTNEQVDAFERDGYLCPVRVFDQAQADRYLARYHQYVASRKAEMASWTPNQFYRVFSETHFVLDWVYEIATNPNVLDAVESLLGPDILAWNTNWFSKMPGEKTYVSWHQDGTYWNLRPPTVVTAWVALTPATPETGCMRVVPGTHTTQFLPQRETYNPDNALSRGQEIAVTVEESRAVDLTLSPGQMSLHHIWIVHGSNANRSKDTPRIGVAIRYTKPEVVQESPRKPVALLVRGRDNHGNFELRNPPSSDRVPLDVHRELVDRVRAGVMTTAKK